MIIAVFMEYGQHQFLCQDIEINLYKHTNSIILPQYAIIIIYSSVSEISFFFEYKQLSLFPSKNGERTWEIKGFILDLPQ